MRQNQKMYHSWSAHSACWVDLCQAKSCSYLQASVKRTEAFFRSRRQFLSVKRRPSGVMGYVPSIVACRFFATFVHVNGPFLCVWLNIRDGNRMHCFCDFLRRTTVAQKCLPWLQLFVSVCHCRCWWFSSADEIRMWPPDLTSSPFFSLLYSHSHGSCSSFSRMNICLFITNCFILSVSFSFVSVVVSVFALTYFLNCQHFWSSSTKSWKTSVFGYVPVCNYTH